VAPAARRPVAAARATAPPLRLGISSLVALFVVVIGLAVANKRPGEPGLVVGDGHALLVEVVGSTAEVAS
jgi:hypothetical protein